MGHGLARRAGRTGATLGPCMLPCHSTTLSDVENEHPFHFYSLTPRHTRTLEKPTWLKTNRYTRSHR